MTVRVTWPGRAMLMGAIIGSVMAVALHAFLGNLVGVGVSAMAAVAAVVAVYLTVGGLKQ